MVSTPIWESFQKVLHQKSVGFLNTAPDCSARTGILTLWTWSLNLFMITFWSHCKIMSSANQWFEITRAILFATKMLRSGLGINRRITIFKELMRALTIPPTAPKPIRMESHFNLLGCQNQAHSASLVTTITYLLLLAMTWMTSMQECSLSSREDVHPLLKLNNIRLHAELNFLQLQFLNSSVSHILTITTSSTHQALLHNAPIWKAYVLQRATNRISKLSSVSTFSIFNLLIIFPYFQFLALILDIA